MSWTIRRLAAALELEAPAGDGKVGGVASLEAAGPEELSFVARTAYGERLAQTAAGCVIVPPELRERVPSVALIAERPHAAFARAAALLHPDAPARGTRAETAAISPQAEVAADADLASGCVVEAGAHIASGVVLDPGVLIGEGVELGPGCRVGAGAVITGRSRLGARVRVQPGAVVGGEGFGYVWDDGAWLRVPQLGRVWVGDDVQIGAGTTIDRGALDDTVIGDGVLLDNQIQVGHNVRIGAHTAIAGCAGIAGSAVIGRRCTIGGAAGIVGHIEIVDDVHITAMSLVSHSILEAGTYAGVPLAPHGEWLRNAARFRQLDAMARRLGKLERIAGGNKEQP